MDFGKIKEQFNKSQPIYENLKEEALFILKSKLESTEIKLHSIKSRIKPIKSFIDKVKRKDSKIPFEEIQDIVGLRVVCLFLSDLNPIGEIIKKLFVLLSEDNKIESNDPSAFGYMSIHYIVKIGEDCSGPRYDLIKDISFEIQVRTLSMDAWATVSSYLDYKTEEDIPHELKRDFYALSGLFYVADTHFEMFYKARQASRQRIKDRLESEKLQEINLDSLQLFLLDKFPDRVHMDEVGYSEIVQELKGAGYTKIEEIEKAIEAGIDAFLKYEEEYPPLDDEEEESSPGNKFKDGGVLRILLEIVDKKFHLSREHREKTYQKFEKIYDKFRKYIKK